MTRCFSYTLCRSSARRPGLRASLLLTTLGLGACVSAPSAPPVDSPQPDNTTVADTKAEPAAIDTVAIDDLIRALVQYRDPITTTLQAGLSMANPGQAEMLSALAEKGYGIQLVDADQGANLLNHKAEDVQNGSDLISRRHTLQVGRLELARDYAIVNELARPTGPLNVAGSRRRIVIDDERFGDSIANDRLVSRIAFSLTNDLRPGDTPRISLLQLPLSGAPENNIGINANGIEVSNVFDGSDNFGSLLDDYSRVEAVNVIFPNDSMRLGNIGRLKIDVFLGDFNEDSDLIRVVGCSNGRTTIAIGNAGLALGRAERVTQELLARGVTREHILDEGCWAPTSAGDRFPSRGVVLELYRTS